MAQQHKEESRSEAVRLALTSGLSRKQIAADFGAELPFIGVSEVI